MISKWGVVVDHTGVGGVGWLIGWRKRRRRGGHAARTFLSSSADLVRSFAELVMVMMWGMESVMA